MTMMDDEDSSFTTNISRGDFFQSEDRKWRHSEDRKIHKGAAAEGV